MKSRNLYRNNS